jgi:arginine decarboxylase
MLDQDQVPLVDAIAACVQRQNVAFHTPGHKGRELAAPLLDLLGSQVFRADLPELPELDNLFAPEGVIQAAQCLAAAAFGAEQTFFLANGSTSGVIAAIAAACKPGEPLILPRNVHQSAVSGLIVSGATPVFVQPDYDPVQDLAHCITPAAVETALRQHPDAKAVLMVSPTYYGACGDVAAIAQLCHQRDIPLIVDEAHGAHFAFHPDLPTPALAAGADVVVQSTHKTLSAFTQAAMMHCLGDRISPTRLEKALSLVQSTSPSYLLLASLDAARYQMATQGKELMERTLELATDARSRLQQISGLSLLHPQGAKTAGFCALDPTRLTVTVADLGLDGFTADEILHTHLGITAEFPSLRHLTFILSLGDRPEAIDRLVAAFEHIASQQLAENRPLSARLVTMDSGFSSAHFSEHSSLTTTLAISPRDAFFANAETVPITQATNRISAELVCPYPPGIPVLIPGELVDNSAIASLQQIKQAGGIISGCADPKLLSLRVVCQDDGYQT